MNFIHSRWFELGEKLFDLIVINFLIILTALPIITCFDAFYSGYQTISRMRRYENLNVFKTFFSIYKTYFFESVGINILFLLWLLIIWGLAGIVLLQSKIWLVVLFAVISIEIMMTLVGTMTQIKKSVHLITLIKLGFIHFHINWLKYISCSLLSIFLLLPMMTIKPIMFSATLYVLQLVVELISRKVEGDIPINFLNVFEKTI